jgi:hypothetical protein
LHDLFQTADGEWRKGNPILEIVSLPEVPQFCQSLYHIVMDDKFVAVVGRYSQDCGDFGELIIHILDSRDSIL